MFFFVSSNNLDKKLFYKILAFIFLVILVFLVYCSQNMNAKISSKIDGMQKALIEFPGKINWELSLDNDFYLGPEVDENNIFILTKKSLMTFILASIDRNIGKINWKTKLHRKFYCLLSSGNVVLLVATSFERTWIYAYDKKFGQLMWKFKSKSFWHSEAITSNPLFFKDKIIFGLSAFKILALSIDNGKTDWEYRMHGGGTRGSNYILKDNNYIYTNWTSSKIHILQPENGTEANNSPINIEEKIIANYIVKNNVIYFPTKDHLLAFDSKTQKILWKILNKNNLLIPLSVKDQTLYCKMIYNSSEQTGIFAIKSENGSIIWEHKIKSNDIFDRLEINNDIIVIQDCSGKLFFIDRYKGIVNWKIDKIPSKNFLHYQLKNNNIYLAFKRTICSLELQVR